MAESLAKQSGVLAERFQLPEVFQSPQEQLKNRYLAPYITFAHQNKSDEWSKLVGKFGKVEEGDMYLVHPDYLVHLDPGKLGWLIGKQFWALKNPAGQIMETSLVEKPKPYNEHVEAVVLVYLEDRVLPANVQFRTTKCPAAKTLADALIDAGGAEWFTRSQAHKETAALQPHAWLRFFGLVTIGPRRTSKSSGLPYRLATAEIRPTSIPEWRLLKEFSESDDCQKQLQDASVRYEVQIAEITSKAK